jgi:hypothetical protein
VQTSAVTSCRTHNEGPTLLTSSKPDYLSKTSSPNTFPLGVWVSANNFKEDTVQSTAFPLECEIGFYFYFLMKSFKTIIVAYLCLKINFHLPLCDSEAMFS